MTASAHFARVLLGTIAGVALLLRACAPSNDNAQAAREGLSGEVVVSGSSTVEPISSLVAEEFVAQNPDVEIAVDGPGTSVGFELFCRDKVDVADASRPIEAEEIEACEQADVEFIELKIAIDGISVITSTENTEIDCLDFKDLYSLLGPESEGFESWSDANGLAHEVGAGHPPYPDAPLDITAPGEESGTYDSFGEIVLEDIAYEQRGIKEDASLIRPDYQSSADDNVIVQGIQGSSSSLGWVGFAFYEENSETVRAVPIAEDGDACVEPTVETIGDGTYPIARDLYIYVNASRVEENPTLEAYVDFYLAEDGLAAVATTGYVDQPQDDLDETIEMWEAKETGTNERS